jgi:type IV pilus assembly protein PilM
MEGISASKLGLDIGSQHLTAVRLTELSGTIETVSVARCGIPEGVIGERGQLTQPQALSAALKLLGKQGGLKARRVLCALPTGLLTVQPMVKPASLSAKETESSIGLELAPALSYALSELRLAWEVTDLQEPSEQVHLVAYACREQDADVRQKAVRAARMSLADLTPEPIALTAAIELDDDKSSREALLHIGLHSSVLLLVGGGKVLYSQVVPLGGASLTSKVSEVSGLSMAEAEQFKRTHSLIGPRENDLHQRPRLGMQNGAENFVDAIYQVLSYDTKGEPVKRLLLSGASAQMDGLPAYFNQLLGLPVDRVKPRSNLRVADESLFPADALAYGLAMHAVSS